MSQQTLHLEKITPKIINKSKIVHLQSDSQGNTNNQENPSIFTLSDTPTPGFQEFDSEGENRKNQQRDVWGHLDAYLQKINELGYDVQLIQEQSVLSEKEKKTLGAEHPIIDIHQNQLDQTVGKITNSVHSKKKEINSHVKIVIQKIKKLQQKMGDLKNQKQYLMTTLINFRKAFTDQLQNDRKVTEDHIFQMVSRYSTLTDSLQKKVYQLEQAVYEERQNNLRELQIRQRDHSQWEQKVKQLEIEIRHLRKQLSQMERQNQDLITESNELKKSQLELQSSKSQFQYLHLINQKQMNYINDLEQRISQIQGKESSNSINYDHKIKEHQKLLEKYYQEKFQEAKGQLREIISHEISQEIEFDRTWLQKMKKEREILQQNFNEAMTRGDRQIQEMRTITKQLQRKNNQLQVEVMVVKGELLQISQKEILMEMKYQAIDQKHNKLKLELSHQVEILRNQVQLLGKAWRNDSKAKFQPTKSPNSSFLNASTTFIQPTYDGKNTQSHVDGILSKLNQRYKNSVNDDNFYSYLPISIPPQKRYIEPTKQKQSRSPNKKQAQQQIQSKKRLNRLGERINRMKNRMELQRYQI